MDEAITNFNPVITSMNDLCVVSVMDFKYTERDIVKDTCWYIQASTPASSSSTVSEDRNIIISKSQVT